ncbi:MULTISPECIES: EAL domain-containing protein [Pseudomonas]|uniref:EAL domain-containing response regulator n=1 Tax=Pseudomonas TaxID=286 RepID=UPI0010C032A5|nr:MULTISPECIES: EAL domain-containing response regulator [Pseudomonas]MBD8193361.1 EAL domain-containing response regulator [Pseudomonas fluorescens]MBD8228551.1 EAL domain-containing response regulator [Pseudomonas fluorescens]MBD8737896.1 EAL domain-containing response regulator [Pseudomonas fluorescens]MBD8786522.1 EAL domain-containing response regulator [Pseudomonas fluorescens]MBD8818378.1 EAL domain-containing response regulator [Pseudomonas fluorescens]
MKVYNVMIVEDHPFQQEYLYHAFSEVGGLSVNTAWGGVEALRFLQQKDYDLVVSDLFMPDMDGVQLIQEIAVLPKRPALALMSTASRRILISAGLAAESSGLTVMGLFSKPVELTAVMQLRDRLDKFHSAAPPADRVVQKSRQLLVRAMKSGQIQAWFQPKKSLRTGRICGAEALVRWRHPTLGLLAPVDFLDAINQFDLQEQLLWRMLEDGLAAQSLWRRHGYDVPISVNLPTHLLDSHDFTDRLLKKVVGAQAEPRLIIFELMESSTTDDPSNFYAGACRLRMMGFGLAQDDFAKGYSSYFNLISTPFNEIKIDRALVHGCVENESHATALQSVVDLCHKLGLVVTAEGVETPAELAFLRNIRCDQVQGYVISGAVASVDFIKMLEADGIGPIFT